MGGISIWQLLIIAVIVVLLFGTKKLRNLGGDLGSAIKGFKSAVSEDKSKDDEKNEKESLADKSTSDSVTEEKSKTKDQA